MILNIPSTIKLWEAIATIQIVQASKCEVNLLPYPGADDVRQLLGCAQIPPATLPGDITLNYDAAYRAVEASERPYCYVLANQEPSFAKLELGCPQFLDIQLMDIELLDIQPRSDAGILLCPFGLRQDLDLPGPVWKAIVRHLRSYNVGVMLMAERDERLDIASFTEAENLGCWEIVAKIQAIASAKLVVGVPNAWTWIATAWEKPIVLLQPDHIPQHRWFPFISPHFGKIGYETRNLQIPTVLAGLRMMIDKLEE